MNERRRTTDPAESDRAQAAAVLSRGLPSEQVAPEGGEPTPVTLPAVTEASLRHGMPLGGRFRVDRPYRGRSRNGSRFLTCELHDGERRVRAYAWEGECAGFHLPRHGDRLYVAGRVRWRERRFELLCRELRVEDADARVRWARERLGVLARALEPVLQAFLRRVLQDPGIGLGYRTVPASLHHHHPYPGGLLVHSVEAALSVSRWLQDDPMQGLAIVAALLHDIGKVRTLTADRTRTRLGQAVDHADLTLEILAAHLAWLDARWIEGGILLRHLLTARARQDSSSPAYGALELVRAADRISAHQAMRGAAFPASAMVSPLG